LLANVDNPQKYNDEIIYPDKIRINLYYLEHYSFIKDIQMIICTVLGKRMSYGGEII
jgi:lipopolysaccharide/colanic/teichoic acid biosynthesis glycosyltransferase